MRSCLPNSKTQYDELCDSGLQEEREERYFAQKACKGTRYLTRVYDNK